MLLLLPSGVLGVSRVGLRRRVCDVVLVVGFQREVLGG